MQSEHRRAVMERLFAEAEDRGTHVDKDPAFREWVEEWIQGRIDVAELRERYHQLREIRLSEKRNASKSEEASPERPPTENEKTPEPDDLLEEITQLTNAFEQTYLSSADKDLQKP
jgi:cobalamin biosynthesis Mg chelatase CobN